MLPRLRKILRLIPMLPLVTCLEPDSPLFAQITATWNGTGDRISYNDPLNCDVVQVPVNGATDFIAVIPSGNTVNYNVPGAGNSVFQLMLSNGSTLHINPERELTVTDEASLDGRVATDNGRLIASSAASQFPGNSTSLLASGGGSLTLAATYFESSLGSGELITVEGLGSLIDLSWEGRAVTCCKSAQSREAPSTCHR